MPVPGFPVILDLAGRRVLVVGLGKVGTRRVEALLSAGAIVIAVDPRPDLHVASSCERKVEPFDPAHLDGVYLVFAAATAEVNRRVVDEARARKIWVNSASETGSGDLTVPAVWRAGRITLAISTSGAAPALSRLLRDRAAAAIKPAEPLVELFANLRPRVLLEITSSKDRRALLKRWADPAWLDVLAADGIATVQQIWLQMLAETAAKPTSLHESPEFP